MIYLDNAATSWPKPDVVTEAVINFTERIGANPGRSGHRLSIEAGRVINGTREKVAALLGADDPLRVVFGPNATAALNLALYGLLETGDHVITSSVEHNSVMRPLRDLESRGIVITVVNCSCNGVLDADAVADAIRANTKLIVLTHGSNVMGTLLPIEEVGSLARRHGLLFLVDSAATAGVVPIDMERMGIDLLAFTGHKHLLGPMGTGGLVVGRQVDSAMMKPLLLGGTGSRSDAEYQPSELPDVYESGTPNASGLAGLGAAVDWIEAQGIDRLREKQITHTERLISGLSGIAGVTVYGTGDARRQTGTVAFNIADSDPGEIGWRLDETFDLLCRIGLHCSPAAHRTMGTFPGGAIRFAPGFFTTDCDIEAAIGAVNSLAGGTSR